MKTKISKELKKDMDDMLEEINNLKSTSDHIKDLNDKIFHLEFLIKQATLQLQNISDVIEVTEYYVDDDTRLAGTLKAINTMVLNTWFSLEDEE